MSAYGLVLALVVVLIVALYFLKRNNKKTIVTVGFLGDDEIDIPFKIESVPGLTMNKKEVVDEVKTSSRMDVIVLLLEELIPITRIPLG